MATRTPKALADGQLPDSKTAIYTTPANTTTYISSITLYNSHATTQTTLLYVNRSGTSRVILRDGAFAQYETYSIGAGLILEAGDTIEATTTTASAVDYQISGIEEV